MGDATGPGGSPMVLGIVLLLVVLLGEWEPIPSARAAELTFCDVSGVLLVILGDRLHGLQLLGFSLAVPGPPAHSIDRVNVDMGDAILAGPGRVAYIPTRRPKRGNAAMGDATAPVKDISSYS